MKLKKLITLSLLLCSTAVLADTGAYGVLQVGRAYSHFSSASYGIPTDQGGDDWVYATKIGLGYQIDDYIGLESTYLSLQDRTFNDLTNASKGVVSEQAFDVLAVVQFPFIADINFIGKIGSAYVNANQKVQVINDEPEITPVVGHNTFLWRPEYAVGLSTSLESFQGIDLSLTYDRIPGDSANNLPDLDFYALGLKFSF